MTEWSDSRMARLPFKTVAFLQNQWFKDPVAAERTFSRYENDPVMRARMVGGFLFAGCTTGRRLKLWLGEDKEDIVWENTTKAIADQSGSKLPPDIEHMQGVLDHFKPNVVLAFGKQAAEAMSRVQWCGMTLITKHPAARPCPSEEVMETIAAWRRERRRVWPEAGTLQI